MNEHDFLITWHIHKVQVSWYLCFNGGIKANQPAHALRRVISIFGLFRCFCFYSQFFRGHAWVIVKFSTQVCGRVYCRQCVVIGMGEMTEGRKCIECLGRRFGHRYTLQNFLLIWIDGSTITDIEYWPTRSFWENNKKEKMVAQCRPKP